MSAQTNILIQLQTLNEKYTTWYLGMPRIWLSQSRMRGVIIWTNTWDQTEYSFIIIIIPK